MRNSLLLTLIFISASLFSQEGPVNDYLIKYSYDAAGNRVKRKQVFIYIEDLNKNRSLPVDTVVEELADKSIKLYPNPVKENVTIDIEDYNNETGNIKVFDIQGKLLISQDIRTNPSYLDFLDKAKGTYLIKIVINDEVTEYTVIK